MSFCAAALITQNQRAVHEDAEKFPLQAATPTSTDHRWSEATAYRREYICCGVDLSVSGRRGPCQRRRGGERARHAVVGQSSASAAGLYECDTVQGESRYLIRPISAKRCRVVPG